MTPRFEDGVHTSDILVRSADNMFGPSTSCSLEVGGEEYVVSPMGYTAVRNYAQTQLPGLRIGLTQREVDESVQRVLDNRTPEQRMFYDCIDGALSPYNMDTASDGEVERAISICSMAIFGTPG